MANREQADVRVTHRARRRRPGFPGSGAAGRDAGESARRDRRSGGQGRAVHRIPRDLRAVLPVLLLHRPAGGAGARTFAPLRGRGDRAGAGDAGGLGRRAPAWRGDRARHQRARPRLALQRAAHLRRRWDAAAQAPQDHADLPRAHDLGSGGRCRPHRGRDGGGPGRGARLLGALQPARPLRPDGAARGDPRGPVPGLHGRVRSSPTRWR